MTVLRLVPEEQHSIRVALTPEDVADLEALARHVLVPLTAVAKQLHDAIQCRDLDRAKVAAAIAYPVAVTARDLVRQMEAE